jgi:hypothetical protein
MSSAIQCVNNKHGQAKLISFRYLSELDRAQKWKAGIPFNRNS